MASQPHERDISETVWKQTWKKCPLRLKDEVNRFEGSQVNVKVTMTPENTFLAIT